MRKWYCPDKRCQKPFGIPKLFPEKQCLIQPASVEGNWYGVYRISNETKKLNEPMTFCAALKTDTTDKEPEGCTRYALPACTYAFFEQSPGYLCELADVMAAKIAEAGFAVAENAICFETDNKERDGTVNVWVPVVTL